MNTFLERYQHKDWDKKEWNVAPQDKHIWDHSHDGVQSAGTWVNNFLERFDFNKKDENFRKLQSERDALHANHGHLQTKYKSLEQNNAHQQKLLANAKDAFLAHEKSKGNNSLDENRSSSFKGLFRAKSIASKQQLANAISQINDHSGHNITKTTAFINYMRAISS